MYLALVQLDGSSIEVHGPGADVWEMLHSPLAHRDLIAAVAPKYSTSSSVVEHDIVALLSQLNDLGYVERIH